MKGAEERHYIIIYLYNYKIECYNNLKEEMTA